MGTFSVTYCNHFRIAGGAFVIYFKVTSHLQGHKKNHFFFSLTKFKLVILSEVYKRKILKISKEDELFIKNTFSNKVNKPGRCHNC